jgi:hypothetical protein
MLGAQKLIRWDHPFPRTGCSLNCATDYIKMHIGKQHFQGVVDQTSSLFSLSGVVAYEHLGPRRCLTQGFYLDVADVPKRGWGGFQISHDFI